MPLLLLILALVPTWGCVCDNVELLQVQPVDAAASLCEYVTGQYDLTQTWDVVPELPASCVGDVMTIEMEFTANFTSFGFSPFEGASRIEIETSDERMTVSLDYIFRENQTNLFGVNTEFNHTGGRFPYSFTVFDSFRNPCGVNYDSVFLGDPRERIPCLDPPTYQCCVPFANAGNSSCTLLTQLECISEGGFRSDAPATSCEKAECPIACQSPCDCTTDDACSYATCDRDAGFCVDVPKTFYVPLRD